MRSELSLVAWVVALCAAMLAIVFIVAQSARAQPVRQQYRDCHHNWRHELVCRSCHVEEGKWRCGQARIVREPAPGFRA